MFSKFLAAASCGQCVPCNSGTRLVTEHLDKIIAGEGSQYNLDEIISITGQCTSQTRCFLPQQEVIVVRSLMEQFSQEFQDCIKNKGLPKDTRELLILKLESYDEKRSEFVIEKNPKEFWDELNLAHANY